MGVFINKPSIHNSVTELVQRYMNGRSGLGMSPTKAEAFSDGHRTGMAEGIAALLQIYRAEQLPHLTYIEPMYDSDVRVILNNVERDKWVHLDGTEKKEHLNVLVELLMVAAVTDDMRQQDEDTRRELVMQGQLPASEDDIEWINAMAEAKRKEVEEILSLLQPSQKSYPGTGVDC